MGLNRSNKIDYDKQFFCRNDLHNLDDALSMLKNRAKKFSKFDESIDIEVVLDVDTNKAEQKIRSYSLLPYGTGVEHKIAVLYKGVDYDKISSFSGVYVGFDDVLDNLKSKKFRSKYAFLVTTPFFLPYLDKVKAILGQSSLYPSIRDGTLVEDIFSSIYNLTERQVNYKSSLSGVIKCSFGRVSYLEKQLKENAEFLITDIIKKHPTNIRSFLIKGVRISTTMGPCVRISLNSLNIF